MKTPTRSYSRCHPTTTRSFPRAGVAPSWCSRMGSLGTGMQHAPTVGGAIPEVIADGESRRLDMAAFSVARFARGRRRGM